MPTRPSSSSPLVGPRSAPALLRLSLLLASLVALAACTQPAAAPRLVAAAPDTIFSSGDFDVVAVIDRAGKVSGDVEVSLGSDPAGFSADPVTTSGDSATLAVSVDPNVAAGDYVLTVNATDGTINLTDEVNVTVAGPAPASIELELRSVLLPTPGDIGFPAVPILDAAQAYSMVPGTDAPAAFGESRAVPGELLVRFAPGAALKATDTLSAGGVTFAPVSTARAPGDVQVIKAAAALSLDEMLALAADLQARPDVVSASPNWIFNAHQAPFGYELQWHYPAIGLHNAWSVETGEANPVAVAVLDTGYQANPDLDGIWLPGYDFAYGDDDPTDGTADFSHGTHVSGTIAMNPANDPIVAGVNRGARIVPVKVLDDTGSGSFEGILYGMLWATGVEVEGYDLSGVPENENPSRVLNLSLGGRTLGCPEELALVTQTLADAGVVVVVSAGNDSQDVRHYAPASCPGVVTVGASGPFDYLSSYSNFGDIDIVAPGGEFNHEYFTQTGVLGEALPAGVFAPGSAASWYWAQGTSMAAPHVTGVVSLLLANDPSLTADGVLDALTSTARPMSVVQCGLPDVAQCGAGLLDAAAALGAADPGPWDDAPVAHADLYACTESDCSDLDVDSEPVSTFEMGMVRGYVNHVFDDLAAGTYFVDAYVDNPTGYPIVQFLWNNAVVELAPGDVNDLVIEAWP